MLFVNIQSNQILYYVSLAQRNHIYSLFFLSGCSSCCSSELMGREGHLRSNQRASATSLLMKPPGWFLATHSISKELGQRSSMHLKREKKELRQRSSMHLKRETVSSTLMGVQSKHLSCPAQTTNILHLMIPLRCLSFRTSKVGTQGSSPCT
jgi:hypothetical protein